MATNLEGLMSLKQIQATTGSDKRINIFDGCVRSGKTLAQLLRWLIYCANGPAGELLITGKNQWSIYRNLILPLQDEELFGPLAKHTKYTINSPMGTILGRRFHVIGANDVRAENRLRGFTCAGALVDEAVLIPRDFWNQLLARMSVPGAKLFATTNPDSPFHWLKTDFIDQIGQPGIDVARFNFKLDDNPSLTPQYKQAIAAEYSGMLYKRMVLGEWTSAQGVIYDMFNPAVHVVTKIPAIKRWLCCAIDYGTASVLHAVVIGIGVDKRLYVVAEWRWDFKATHKQLTDMEYADKINKFLDGIPLPEMANIKGVTPQWMVVDPSASSFITQLFRDGQNPTKADNSVIDGIRTVSSLLSSKRLFIHTSCEFLIREMTGYVWDDKQVEKGIDAPLKVNDHGVDALRYGIFTLRNIWQHELIPEEIQPLYETSFEPFIKQRGLM